MQSSQTASVTLMSDELDAETRSGATAPITANVLGKSAHLSTRFIVRLQDLLWGVHSGPVTPDSDLPQEAAPLSSKPHVS